MHRNPRHSYTVVQNNPVLSTGDKEKISQVARAKRTQRIQEKGGRVCSFVWNNLRQRRSASLEPERRTGMSSWNSEKGLTSIDCK